MSSLTALLHPKTPPWLRSKLTRELSSIPLYADRHGVRTIVQFLIGKQQDPSISQLDHIGKVVGSIPTWITPEEYISQIAAQVIELLDEKDVLLHRAAGHILAQLVMRYMAFTTKYILKPIGRPLLPTLSGQIPDEFVSGDDMIELSLIRMERITLNPSPPLIT